MPVDARALFLSCLLLFYAAPLYFAAAALRRRQRAAAFIIFSLYCFVAIMLMSFSMPLIFSP